MLFYKHISFRSTFGRSVLCGGAQRYAFLLTLKEEKNKCPQQRTNPQLSRLQLDTVSLGRAGRRLTNLNLLAFY